MVCVGPSGKGNPRPASQLSAGSGGGSGHPGAGDDQRWDQDREPACPQKRPGQDQALTAGGIPAKKGSANREKAVRQLARAHLRVANVRKDALHQVTSRLATLAPAASAGETKSAVVLEDLHVSGMVKNHHLAQAIEDVGFYEFRRQMAYKGQWYGCQIILANRFYPSSKRCSQCGHIQATLDLGTRVYICEHCGLMIDRDLNAARNLEQLATGSSPERYAWLERCKSWLPGSSRRSRNRTAIYQCVCAGFGERD